MTRNEDLIRKYKRMIEKLEKEILLLTFAQSIPKINKVSVLKMVIKDLEN